MGAVAGGTSAGSAPPRSGAPARSEAQSTDKPPRRNDPVPTPLPFLLDFYPPEDPKYTRIAPFFDALRKGSFTTTRCEKDGTVLWPPRVVCSVCRGDQLAWIDLPKTGTLYAFSAVLGGAPMGMEEDVPFVVGMVDLDGAPLRLFSRIGSTRYEDCRIGMPVRLETYDLPDGRTFFRFRPR